MSQPNGLLTNLGINVGTPGSWSFMGQTLPDFGISEAFGSSKSGSGGGQTFQNPSIPYSSPQKVLGSSTTATPSGPGGAYPVAGGTPQGPGPFGNTGGGGGDSLLAQLAKTERNAPQEEEYQRLLREAQNSESNVRNSINSGYDSYFNSLNSILNQDLPSQRSAQEQIAQSQYQQGLNTLGSQKDMSLNDLSAERAKTEGSQGKTLKDISSNIRNSMLAGNVYLGARGAGDSSASNQYAYALTKLGSQQRGDVQSQYADIYNDINNREFKVKNIYDTEVKNLEQDTNQKMSSIAQWFSEQQSALKQAQANGQLARGQDLASLSQNLLNNALSQLNQIKTEASNRRASLEEWAMSNSQNINQLKSNFASISSAPYAQAPQAQALPGINQQTGGSAQPNIFGYGYSNEDRNKLFG